MLNPKLLTHNILNLNPTPPKPGASCNRHGLARALGRTCFDAANGLARLTEHFDGFIGFREVSSIGKGTESFSLFVPF